MEPFPNNAVAVKWEFRCHSKEFPGRPWDWQCRSSEGAVMAKSRGRFTSLREALADANANGFSYQAVPEGECVQDARHHGFDQSGCGPA